MRSMQIAAAITRQRTAVTSPPKETCGVHETVGDGLSSTKMVSQTDTGELFDGRGSGHLGPAVGLKTLSIHVCVCPHFGM